MRGAVDSSNGKGWSYKTQNEADACGPAGQVGILLPHEGVGRVGFGKGCDANHDDEPHAHIDEDCSTQLAGQTQAFFGMQAIRTADLGIQWQDLVTKLDEQRRRPSKHHEYDKNLPWLTIIIGMP